MNWEVDVKEGLTPQSSGTGALPTEIFLGNTKSKIYLVLGVPRHCLTVCNLPK